jgi:hypothetical protein
VRRVSRDGPLIFSIHVPKTAGSRFGRILKARYGDAFAYYYGPRDERTHPAARVPPGQIDAEVLKRLEAAGVRILHGHIRANILLRTVPDPSRYWIWLREPVEQTLSHYHFIQSFEREGGALFQKVRAENTSLAEFVELPQVKNIQATYVGRLPLQRAGFVGVTELFSALLPLLRLSDRRLPSNVNRNKPVADVATREMIAGAMAQDAALYSLAMELSLRRLGVRDTPREAAQRRLSHLSAMLRPGGRTAAAS